MSGDGVSDDGCVHLEAWSEESYTAYLREKARAAAQRYSQPQESDDDEPAPVPQQVEVLRITLKARNAGELKLKAKPTTQLKKLLNAFRKACDVDPNMDLSLLFDGDLLDPEDTVADVHVEDMDTIDVHVK